MLRRVGIARIAARDRRNVARLIGRLGRVHRIAVRRDGAGNVLWRTLERARRRSGGALQTTVAIELGHDAGRGVGKEWRAGAGEPEVVEIRAAEGAHEKVVGEREFRGDFPHRHRRSIVMTHDQAARVRYFCKAIHAAAVDLLLVAIELMHEVARGDGQGLVDRRLIDAEGLVLELHRKGGVGLRAARDPHWRQPRQRLAVMIELGGRFRPRVGDPVRARVEAVQIVKAAIFSVDDDDVLDLGEPLIDTWQRLTLRRWWNRLRCGRFGAAEQHEGGDDSSKQCAAERILRHD